MTIADKDYIIKNIRYGKNTMGWEASFTCADGYRYGIYDSTGGRQVKNRLRDRIVLTVMSQKDHPIQKVSRKA